MKRWKRYREAAKGFKKRFCPGVGGNVQPLGKKEGRRCARSVSRFIDNSILQKPTFGIGQEAMIYGNFTAPHGLSNLSYSTVLPAKNVCAMIMTGGEYSCNIALLLLISFLLEDIPRMEKSPPLWVIANAWREIFTRIFEDVDTQYNVSPEWLVNPATNRRLKLDMLYPDIGIAVRLEGLTAKKRRQRLSLQEEEQEQIRLRARDELCRQHKVELIVVNIGDKPQTAFRTIDMALSRAAARVQKPELIRQVSNARAIARRISQQVQTERDFSLYADLWEDRQYQIPEPVEPPSSPPPSIDFKEGMEVEHTTFGPGVIVSVTPGEDETLLSVDFVTAGPKTLAASLVAGKLAPK